jgi:predicted ATPase/class 3 adenylate cyclase
VWHPVRVSAGGPPSGVVTFLFTDIEGSTRRWEADAQSMRAALVAHDEALRVAIEGHGGYLFSHTGDGVVAAFASPKAAVDAAVGAQRALELPVRMGIATGEAERRDEDYFGTVLNRAARVMAAGHGGQILIADSTAILLSGVDLVDLGPRRLRDVSVPVGVFQVRAQGLATEFPPLRALDTSPGNLRPQTTSFIGREAEAAELQDAVKSHRLVTLTGVGGVGKTRLATEIAARLADEFPDGVWFFDLAAVTDPASVPDAVAAVLGITQQPGKTVADSVAAALEGRLRLLVFDNCEHVRDAAADLVEAILAQSATVRLLATSREGLGVADEQLWLVPSLDLDAGTDCAAVTLFVERACSVAQRFSLARADDAETVVEICRRLDGIPLAIELAASRMASMTASEVRDRLDDRFRLLVRSRRAVDRHQTLRNAVAWSYDLLDDPEKSLLTRCSVFAGGFDLESACALAGSDVDDYAVLDLLDTLVRKSLLVVDRSSARTRYSILETIRQFTEEQLVARGAATDVRAAHARHFAGREADVLALWDSPRQSAAYTWLTTELANLRTAFRWSADHHDLDIAAAIASYAAFVGTWVEQHEPAGWAEELIEPAKAVEHRRLAQLYVMASSCYAVGRIADAVGYAEAGRLAIASGRFDKVFDEAGHGVAYMIGGQPERWVDWCRNMIARDQGADSYTRACLVVALTIAGASEEAIEASDGLSAAADATDNPAVVCYALLAYGFARRDADPIAAYEVVRRGLTIALDSGNRSVGSHLAVSLSRLAVAHGDPIDAFDFVELAIRNYYDSGSFSFLHSPLAILVTLFHRLGHYEPAATISGFAVNPLARAAFPEINSAIAHLRDILGDPTYESLARKGETMSTAAIATYAYDQIDQARAELNAVSK